MQHGPSLSLTWRLQCTRISSNSASWCSPLKWASIDSNLSLDTLCLMLCRAVPVQSEHRQPKLLKERGYIPVSSCCGSSSMLIAAAMETMQHMYGADLGDFPVFPFQQMHG